MRATIWHEISKVDGAHNSAREGNLMLLKSEADGRKPAGATTPVRTGTDQTFNAQDVVTSAFALERRAGWHVPRRSNRPINLERRARFARIETA